MIYVTGDIHGDQILWDACISNFLKEGDNIIVLGDFGIGFFDGRYWPEEMFYDYLAEQKYTVLFVDIVTITNLFFTIHIPLIQCLIFFCNFLCYLIYLFKFF